MLYLVPTPVGNLEDITFRAIKILKEVDYILAEDTRTSKKLLTHYQIESSLRSHHAHNEHQQIANIVQDLKQGKKVALITDAGTPGISDPGFLLCRACIKENIEVTCLPGATAFVPALVSSGLSCDSFYFAGFLPHKKGRKTILSGLAQSKSTFVLYESTHRILKTMEQLIEFCGEERNAVVCREISKIYEDKIRGNLSDILSVMQADKNKTKGEIVIVVEGLQKTKNEKDLAEDETD